MVELYVGEFAVAWARPGGTEVFEDAVGFAPALRRCLRVVERERRWFQRSSVCVWLSGALARPFVVEPVAGLLSASEAQAIAKAAAGAATGIAPPCAVQLEGRPTSTPTLATAVAQSVIDQVQAAMQAQASTLVSLRPWWAHALEARLRQSTDISLVAVDEPDGVTLLGSTSGIANVATTLAPRPEPEQTLAVVRRLCLGRDVSVDRVSLCVLDVGRFHEEAMGLRWSALEEPRA